MKKFMAIFMAALLLVLTFAGCAKAPEDKEDPSEATSDAAVEDVSEDAAAVADIDYVKANGKLVIGITEFEPMDYKAEDGSWIGFDADMAKAFAKSLGVEAEFVLIDWDNKVFELKNKTIDCVWNGMTLTDDVKTAMSCSNAYCNNAQVVIVRADVADKYQTADACKELKFAVEAGSAGYKEAVALGYDYKEVADQATALMEVKSGTSDAAIIDSLMAAAMVGEGTNYADLTYTAALNSEEYGVGFRKGSDLTAALNDFFAASLADGSMEACAVQYKIQAALIK